MEHPHRKTIHRFYEPGHLHELTFSCYQRLPLLTDSDRLFRLARCIDSAGDEANVSLAAFVFMPEHVHLLVHPRSKESSLSFFLARLKQPLSKQIKEILTKQQSEWLNRLTIQERPGKTCFRFWQEGPGFDRNIFTPTAITGSLDYFHANPVKRGLCDRAVEWKWSSARYYLSDPPKQHDPDLPHIHGLPDGALT